MIQVCVINELNPHLVHWCHGTRKDTMMDLCSQFIDLLMDCSQFRQDLQELNESINDDPKCEEKKNTSTKQIQPGLQA